MQTFVAALDTMFGGFRERAEQTYALLQAPGTAFVVVAAPERDALREASYFVERLGEEGMPLAGLVLNRVQADGAGLSVAAAEAAAERSADDQRARARRALLRLHAERVRLAARGAALRRRSPAAHPRVPVVRVPAQAGDVHDLAGLRAVGAALAADRSSGATQLERGRQMARRVTPKASPSRKPSS